MRFKNLASVLLLALLSSSCGFSDGMSDSSPATSQPGTQVGQGEQIGQTSAGNQTANGSSTSNTATANSELTVAASNQTVAEPVASPQASATAQQFDLSGNGVLGFSDLTEASGLAASLNQPNRLWVIADSGNSAEIFAINDDGSEVARIALSVTNRDWEEMAAFTFAGQNYLLVADTGDNLRQYSSYPLHIIPEPSSTTSTPIDPLVTFNLTYPDGAHDVEALAVAESDGNLYLITKDDIPGVYAAPLLATLADLTTGNDLNLPTQTHALLANRVGDLQPPEQTATDSILGMLAGVNLGSVTAMDIDNVLSRAWLLTYRGIYLLQADGNSTWGQILTSPSTLIARHSLGQAEALAHSRLQNAVFLTSEGRASPLLRLTE